MANVLDDPAWWSLTGAHARFAHGSGTARRIDPAYSFMSATRPDASPDEAGRDLGALFAPGARGVLVGAAPLVPVGFHETGRGEAHQMVLDRPDVLIAVATAARRAHERRGLVAEPEVLGATDVEAMIALVELARPGPFFARTIELGTYVGLRVEGALVAMAGERMRPDGHVEISAVSTHESQRRRGLASIVVAEVATRAMARGDTPFLHVAKTNTGARPVYERLGFVVRRPVWFVAIERCGAEAHPTAAAHDVDGLRRPTR